MSLVLTTSTNPGTASWQPLPASPIAFAAQATSDVAYDPGLIPGTYPITSLALTIPAGTLEYGDVLEYGYTGFFNDLTIQTAKVGFRIASAATQDNLTVGDYTTSGVAFDYLNVYLNTQPVVLVDPSVNVSTCVFTSAAQGDSNPPPGNLPFVRWQVVNIDKDFPLVLTPIVQWVLLPLPTKKFTGNTSFVRITRPT